MPAVSGGDLTKLRGAHASDMYLAVLVPADIITAQADGAHSRGDETITCKTIVGTQANVKSEMIVWFGSTAGGYDLGKYMAKSMVGGTLTLEENDLDLAGDEYITVKELWSPQSKLPNIDVSGADVVFTKWGNTYTDENTNTPVVNCMGPPDCQFIDEDLGYAEVRFIDEYSWSPVGASKDVVTWNYDGGAYQSGSGTVASPNLVRYDTAGTYWISLTITDSNGTVSVSWRPVFIFDSDNMPYMDWTSRGRQLTQTGNSQGFIVVGDADESEFPPNTWVVRFNRDYYAGSEAVIENTYPHRGHIKFVGFIREGSVQTDTDVSTVEFDAIDITIYMDELPAFGDVIKDTASPSIWTEMTNPTVIRAVIHVLMWQSNILTIADLRFGLERTDPGELYIAAQRWGKGSLLEQVNLPLLYKGIYAQCSGNKQGLLNVRQDPLMVDHSARSAYVTTVAHLTTADYSQLTFTTKYNQLIQYVRFTGIAYDGSSGTPYGSKAPGIPDQALDVQDVGGQVLVDQSDTNRLSGDLKAKLENDIISAQMSLPGNWDIFDPSLQERITFDLDPTENNLGLDYDNSTTWIVREVGIEEDPHTGVVSQVVLTVEKETYGVDGVTLPIGTEPTWVTPIQPVPEPHVPGDVPRFEGVIIGGDGWGVAYCEDGELSGTPVWQDLQSSQLAGTGGKTVWGLTFHQGSSGELEWLFAATQCAVYRYPLPIGSGGWQKGPALAQLNLFFPTFNLTDVRWKEIRMSTTLPGWGYCAGSCWKEYGLPSYLFLAHTRDNWQTLYAAYFTPSGTHFHPSTTAHCMIIPGTDEADCLLVGSAAFVPYLYKITGYCTGIVLLDSDPSGGLEVNCFVAPGDANYMYYTQNTTLHYSSDEGSSFDTVATGRQAANGLGGARANPNKVEAASYDTIYTYTVGDGAVAQWGVSWAYPGTPGTGGAVRDMLVTERDSNGNIVYAIRVGGYIGVPNPPRVRLDEAATSTVKTGNLAALVGDGAVRCIAKLEDRMMD